MMQMESYYQTSSSKLRLNFRSYNPAEHSVCLYELLRAHCLFGINYKSQINWLLCSLKHRNEAEHGSVLEQAGIWASKGGVDEAEFCKFILLTSVCFTFGSTLPHLFK